MKAALDTSWSSIFNGKINHEVISSIPYGLNIDVGPSDVLGGVDVDGENEVKPTDNQGQEQEQSKGKL